MRPCLLAFLVAFAINAQTFTASVLGTITDPSGSAVPSATVTATNAATNVQAKTVTDQTGRYLLPTSSTWFVPD